MPLPNKMYTECPYCHVEGLYYWHHVFGGAYKKKSEQYNAVIYPCWACHVTNSDSIHRNAEKNNALKREHRDRIMLEHNWTIEQFIKVFGKSYEV